MEKVKQQNQQTSAQNDDN